MSRLFLLFFAIPMLGFGQQASINLSSVAAEVQDAKSLGLQFQEVSLFKTLTDEQKSQLDAALPAVDGAVFFEFLGASSLVGKSIAQAPVSIALPAARRGAEVILDLMPVELFSGDFVSNVDIAQALHYRGVVRGQHESLASISIFNDEVIGFVSMDGLTMTLGKVKGQGSSHVLYSEMSQNWELDFSCSDTEIPMNYIPEKVRRGNAVRNPGDCIRLKFEMDESLTNQIGSLTQATNYGLGLFNAQQTLYANDGINVILSELKVWTNADPAPYVLDGYETLDSYQALTGSFNADVAYLSFSNGFSGGEAASIGGICQNNPYFAKAMGGAYGYYYNLPTYSFDVFIISHEVGHLFGARHTHACVWNGNNTAIDGCANFTEGGCSTPSSSPFYGTIMSYCSSADFSEGFHPQVAASIQDYIASRTCTAPCGPPTCDDGFQNGDETGVDCGGSDCPDCPSCDDGEQNGLETGVDCGGNCEPCPCIGGANISISITMDDYPQETSWTLSTGGSTVASGGLYTDTPDGSTVSEVICLPAACYEFTLSDSYGDGICCAYGLGVYEVAGPDGVIASGGSFQYDETTSFCVEETTSECVEDINANGIVDIGDVIALNSVYGTACSDCPEDLNGDGMVNLADFLQLNSSYGMDCSQFIPGGQANVLEALAKAKLSVHPEIKNYLDTQRVLLKVYPNPVREELNLSLMSNQSDDLQILITDVQGRILQSEAVRLKMGANQYRINTDDLSTGSYLLILNSSNLSETQKFEVRR